MDLYPLKFNPIFCYRIWGGEKLKTVLNKDYKEKNIGESWEISNVSDYETTLSNGPLKGKTLKELIETYQTDLVGKKVFHKFGDKFPLLIKFIDAKAPLSIQVHPSNKLAKERHNSFGKNEMWYVMQANENSELIVGFDQKITPNDYKTHLENSTIVDMMHHEKVEKGDTFYIPTGRVHAIGAGVLLAEIQQTSNITYRIYDYDRIDSKTGEKRDLHNDLAIDTIDYQMHDNYKTAYQLYKNKSSRLVHSPYFKTNIIHLEGEIEKNYYNVDSFIIYMCVEGEAIIEHNNTANTLNLGETILIPSAIKQISLKSSSAKLLEVHM